MNVQFYLACGILAVFGASSVCAEPRVVTRQAASTSVKTQVSQEVKKQLKKLDASSIPLSTATNYGLKARTVGGAFGEIGSSITALIAASDRKQSGRAQALDATSTTWQGKGLFIGTGGNYQESETVTLVFFPTSETEGTWKSNPYPLFWAGTHMMTPGAFQPGTYEGKYKLIGDSGVAAYDALIVKDSHPSATTASFTVRGKTLTFVGGASYPTAFMILTRCRDAAAAKDNAPSSDPDEIDCVVPSF